MNFKALIGVFSLFVSSISALSLPYFPLNLKVHPGSELSVKLEGSNVSAGSKVKVELWDNRHEIDVTVADLGDYLIVDENNSLNLTIPSDLPKTHNAFLRVYFEDENVVSPRFSIKNAKNCLSSKVLPTIYPTIYPTIEPTCEPTIIPTSIHTIVPTSVPTDVKPEHSGDHEAGHSNATSGAPSVTATRAAPIRTVSTVSSSTSNASIAKISAGSIAVAVIVAFSMLF